METIADNLYQSHLDVPEQTAITLLHSHGEDQSITYHQLFAGAAGYTAALERAGISADEVVILILNHGADLVYAFFGVALRGAIPSIMPYLTEKLAPDRYRASITALFEITEPAGVITHPAFLNEVEKASARAPSVRSILTTEHIHPLRAPDPKIFTGLEASIDEIALLQHSSGTTGLQKGVALSQRAIFNQLYSYRRAIALQNSDVVVSWLPLYHDMGLIAGFLLPLLGRIHLVLLSPFDWVRAPYKLMQAVTRYRGTLSWLPNFAYNFCAQKIRERDLIGVDLSTWRAVINCSEPMHWKSHRMFLERFAPYGLREYALATSYAMAENVFAVTQGGIDAPVREHVIERSALLTRQVALTTHDNDNSLRMLSAGKPIDNTRLRIIDAKGKVLPERHIGEIAIQSNCMLDGYYHRPELTTKAFLDGWYLTGDLGYVHEGELYVTGRKKDLIIVGGKNIYPQDLERLASEVPGVHPGRVAAFGVFNEKIGTEDVMLIAEVDGAGENSRREIGDEIRTRITKSSDIALRYVHLVPRGWLLKTSSGKVNRDANRGKYLKELAQQ